MHLVNFLKEPKEKLISIISQCFDELLSLPVSSVVFMFGILGKTESRMANQTLF